MTLAPEIGSSQRTKASWATRVRADALNSATTAVPWTGWRTDPLRHPVHSTTHVFGEERAWPDIAKEFGPIVNFCHNPHA